MVSGVPDVWWYPDLRGAGPASEGALAGVFLSSGAVLFPDGDEFLDYEQGAPHSKGFPEQIVKIDTPETMSPMVRDWHEAKQ